MVVKVTLDEVLSRDLIVAHRDHITDFFLQEGIRPDPDDLGKTQVTERQLKELLAELAHDLPT